MNGTILIIPNADFSQNGMPTKYTAKVKVAETSDSLQVKMIDSGVWNYNNISNNASDIVQTGGTEKTVVATAKEVEAFIKWNGASTSISFDTSDGAKLSYIKLYRSSKDSLTSLDNLLPKQTLCKTIDFSEFNGNGINSLRGAFAQPTGNKESIRIIGIESLITPYSELKTQAMFQYARINTDYSDIDLSAWKAIVTDGNGLGSTFNFLVNKVNSLNISGWDLSGARTMYQTFTNISNLYLNGTKIYTGTYSYIIRPINVDCVYVDGVINQNNDSAEAKTWLKNQLDSAWNGSYIAQPQDSNGNVVSIANAFKLVKTAV